MSCNYTFTGPKLSPTQWYDDKTYYQILLVKLNLISLFAIKLLLNRG